MKISQGNVTILETCPRLFQHQVLEQLGVPQLGEVWERLQLGSQFHQIMQQRAQNFPMGVLQSMVATDPDLSRWWQAVVDYGNELFPDRGAWTDSEHVRTWECLGHTIVGIYDYLVLYPESAQILDWKTYPRPIETQKIQRSWQSRLYPFLLAQTSDYLPEKIEMRYWFFQGGDREASQNRFDQSPSNRPQLLRLSHSHEQQAQTLADLTVILTNLNQWLGAYQLGEDFPQTGVRSTCETCAFAVRCDRVVNSEEAFDEVLFPGEASAQAEASQKTTPTALTWDEVDEVAIVSKGSSS
jgi:PD-(D/E)XK nuclease superfamily